VSGLDRVAFEALYTRLERPLYNVVYRRLWRADEAADVVQETFVRLWGMRERVRMESVDPLTWRIALNLASRRARTHRRWGWLSFDVDRHETAAVSATDASESERALRAAVDALPEKLRDVVLLTEFSELSYAQVAETLAIPPGTVASRRSLAVERLRGMLRTEVS
jgi:RNA polymerase sigma-70 factor (ECF subfamily)